jgi:hypothetical protein
MVLVDIMSREVYSFILGSALVSAISSINIALINKTHQQELLELDRLRIGQLEECIKGNEHYLKYLEELNSK